MKLYKLLIKVNKWIIDYVDSEELEIKYWYNKADKEHYLILTDGETEYDYIKWKDEEA